MDTVGEFLTRIRNAGSAKHDKVDVPSSNLRVGIANVLKDKGFIRDFRVVKDSKQGMMRVYLRYNDSGDHAITKVFRVSRPGLRKYCQAGDVPKVRNGFGIAIMSTNGGVMSGDEAAEKNVGGEILCKIW